MKCSYVSLLICSIFMLLCVFPINGCLTDWDDKSLHNRQSADYNKVPYEYSSQQRQIVASEKSELKFMTFNQRSGFIDGCVNNVTAQALVIREVDYVGTQETVQNVDTRCNRCNIPQIIANVAGMATRFGMAIPWRTGQYGIMAGTSQRIIETKYLSIPYTGFETRTAVAVKTQPAALQGRFLWFIDVHIEYYSIAVRQFQMSEILKWINADIIAKDSKAVIVMAGDFNGGPWQYEYGTLKEAGYKNSWEVFYGSILEGNTIPADWPGVRFDHIWYRAPTGVTINVKHAQVLNVRLSDHRPYVATLSFTVEGSVNPTVAPTVAPTVKPTVAPTVAPPTAAPTTRPTTTPTTPPTTAPRNVTVCQGPIWENNLVTIKCPELNQRITSYQFASYGTPEGTCGNFKHGNCYGGSSPYVVKDKCVGYNSCVFPIANNVFGDPCPGTGKNFRVQVTCSS